MTQKCLFMVQKVSICTFTDKGKQLIANTAISAYLCFPIFAKKFDMDKKNMRKVVQ